MCGRGVCFIEDSHGGGLWRGDMHGIGVCTPGISCLGFCLVRGSLVQTCVGGMGQGCIRPVVFVFWFVGFVARLLLQALQGGLHV